MRIKILLSSNPFYTASASANRWLTLIQGLNNLGIEIQLVIYGNYQSNAEKVNNGSDINSKGIEIKYLTSKIVDTLWQRRFDKYIGKYLQHFQITKKIVEELSDFEGIVWTENDIIVWKIIHNIPQKSFKLITEMSEFLDIHQYNNGNSLQRKLGDAQQKFFENYYIKKLNGLILMTKTLINHFENFSNHKPKTLHLPMTVDLERFNIKSDLENSLEKPYIVFVGVMNDAKDGVNILIQSFAKISNEFQEYKLYLIGGWNYDTPEHLALIKTLNLEDRIKWLGEFSREKIPAILQNASLLVLPRPDSKQAQGGFPTKLGEYLASGVPVCATTVGEIPDYLTDNESVFFAEPGSVDSFAQAMERALSNPELANKIGQAGKLVAETHFNKDIQAQKLYEFLKTL